MYMSSDRYFYMRIHEKPLKIISGIIFFDCMYISFFDYKYNDNKSESFFIYLFFKRKVSLKFIDLFFCV